LVLFFDPNENVAFWLMMIVDAFTSLVFICLLVDACICFKEAIFDCYLKNVEKKYAFLYSMIECHLRIKKWIL